MAKCLYDAALDGVSIHSLADEIILLDIVENPVDMDIQSAKRSMHPGTRVTSRIRRKLEIDLVCVIYTQDSTRRAEVASLLAAWTNAGGWLSVSTRPGKHIRVRPSTMPAQGSALRWQDDITITLTAYEQPYWEDVTVAMLDLRTDWDESLQTYTDTAIIEPDGNAGKIPVTVSVRNFGDEALTHLKIVADDTFIELKGLNAPPDTSYARYIGIEYTEDDVLRIFFYDNESEISLMSARTAESSDDLLVKCGQDNRINVYSDVPVAATVYRKGRWL